MLINAQALINMSLSRLCYKAHRSTLHVWATVREAVRHQDPDLAGFMVPKCGYRGGVCHELMPCGLRKDVKYARARRKRKMEGARSE